MRTRTSLRRGEVSLQNDIWGIFKLPYVEDVVYNAAMKVVDLLDYDTMSTDDEIHDVALEATQDIYSGVMIEVLNKDPEFFWDMPAELLDVGGGPETLRDVVAYSFSHYLHDAVIAEVKNFLENVARDQAEEEESEAVVRHHEQVIGRARRRR